MTKRYYKATDGTFTIFRATDSRIYKGAWMTVDGFKTRPRNMGFSGKYSGALEAIEIGKGEYDALVLYKKQRTDDNAPSASWVRNADLPPIVSGAVPPNAHRDIEWSE